MKVPSQGTQKLDDRSMPIINFGKESGTKGYRSYSLEKKKVYASKDVTFEEEKSWTWETKKK